MHAYVKLAVSSIREYITTGNKPKVPDPLPEDMKRRAGVFVSLKKHKQLRGCIGTIEPSGNSLAEEIIDNALSAATRDGRFEPVGEDELDDLDVSVDILSPPEPVESVKNLDPEKYGVIVTSGSRRGLLLPDIEGVNTVEEQILICRRKGGILPGDRVSLECFTVTRYR